MQSDVLNDKQQLSNDTDYSTSLSTTLIYSGLKLHPKTVVPTISMSSMTSPVSIVKKLSLPDAHPDHINKSLGSSVRHSPTSTTPPSIRLVTPTTGKSSPPTTLQFQLLDKSSTTTNGGFSTSKTYIFNSQTTNSIGTSSSSSTPLVTLMSPSTTSPKIQTLISTTSDVSSTSDHNPLKQSTFLSKNRLTLVQPIITNSASSVAPSNSVTPKLVIQQNPTSSIWSQPSTTKIVSAKMFTRPIQLIPSSEHTSLASPTSTDNSIFPTKTLDSGQAFIQMSLFPPTSTTEPINSVQLTNFYTTPPSVRISTAPRSMDHNNNHSVTAPVIREIQTDEQLNDSNVVKSILHSKSSPKNRARLPLQPSTQQISSILPPTKKHKLPEDEQVSSSEPPNKIVHYEQFDESSHGKKIRKSRHKTISKISIENTTPNSSAVPLMSSNGIDTTEKTISKKRSSAEIATAAILSSNSVRKKRVQKMHSDEITTNNANVKHESIPTDESSNDVISDELLKRLSQDFVYVDKRTGIRWIGTKARTKPMNTLLSRVLWKPKINHYVKYSDIIRTNSKRIVPVRSLETTRKKLTVPWGSWRIDRLKAHITDLTSCQHKSSNGKDDWIIMKILLGKRTEDEQTSQSNLSDIAQCLDQLDINEDSIRSAIGDLIEDNIQRHRHFCEQLSQISALLMNLLDHGKNLREICSNSKMTSTSISISTLSSATTTTTTTTRRLKDR